MTGRDASDAQPPRVGSGSTAAVLVAAQCGAAVLACLLVPWFGWVAAFAVASRFAVLARRAQDPSLFRVAGWAMVVLGLVNAAVVAVLSAGTDQVHLR